MNKAERARLRIQPTTHLPTVIMRSKDLLSLLDTCDALEAEIEKLKAADGESVEVMTLITNHDRAVDEVEALKALCRRMHPVVDAAVAYIEQKREQLTDMMVAVGDRDPLFRRICEAVDEYQKEVS